jgi:hypothetical protein
MPDTRKHRGPHPDDATLFLEQHWPSLQEAAQDHSWLLTRGYAPQAALKLVGDRFALHQRQRLAVLRSSCSDQALVSRTSRQVQLQQLNAGPIWLDGFNVLTTVESALSRGILLRGRDGCIRDMASMHGTYRKVSETLPAAKLIGEFLADSCPDGAICWWLDRPVSNSGRLRMLLEELSRECGWQWEITLENDPDRVLKQQAQIPIATADSVILDSCGSWINLASAVITMKIPTARVVPMCPRE